MMPAVVTRRSRLSYATDLDTATETDSVQTPIERVPRRTTTDQTVHFESRVTKHQWKDGTVLDNIRLTPFGPERTEYTYGDSGSYRTDRLQTEWDSPNLSRLPLRHLTDQELKSTITTLCSREETTIQMLETRRTTRGLSSTTTNFTDSEEADNDEETSSRRSAASSSNSVHTGRFRCQLVKGEWCTHEECSVYGIKTRRQSLGRQRNITNTTHLLTDQSESDSPATGTRSRGTRRSARTLTKTTVATSHVLQSGPMDMHVQADGAQHMGASSSTYVYHCVPHVDSADTALDMTMQPPVSGDGPGRTRLTDENGESWTKRLTAPWSRPTGGEPAEAAVTTHSYSVSKTIPDDSRTRNWFAQHIFGLEKTSRDHEDANSYGQFISSDAEDDSTFNGLLTARRHVRRAAVNRHEFTSHSPARPLQDISNCGFRSLHMIRRGTIEGLALVLAVFYALGNLLSGALRLVSNVCQRIVWKLFALDAPDYSSEKPIHPRLAQFSKDTHSISQSTLDSPGLIYRIVRVFWVGLKHLFSHCCRLLGFLCFLIPFLLLLAFLFAPVALDEDSTIISNTSSHIRSPFLSDVECNRSVIDVLPRGSSTWQIAWWRFRCLYHYYILTPSEPQINGTNAGGPLTILWATLMRWWSQKPLESRVEPVPHLPIFNGSSESKFSEQLAEFTRVVNQRLDFLSENLRSTNARVSNMAAESKLDSNSLNAQLSELHGQLNMYAEALKQWQLEWQRQETLNKMSRTSTGETVSNIEAESLLRSATNMMNQSIIMQFDALRAEMRADQSGYWKQYEERLSKLSLLLTNLRFQLTYRIRQTDHELNDLRSQMRSRLDKQTTDDLARSTTINELRLAIDQLETRQLELEKANRETESTVLDAQEAIRRCNEQQSQTSQDCRQAATEQINLSIAKLTEQLTTQITWLVEDAVRKQMTTNLYDSELYGHLNEMVTRVARESVNKVLSDKTHIGLDSTHHLMNVSDLSTVQGLIDTALQRFAADRTGMADFALESAGGAIVGTRCTRTYTEGSALFSIFGIPLARLSNSPRTILQPGNNPGDCWPFHGSTGQAVIRLSAPILISAVSLEHLPRALAPNERLDSAPKDFVIKGLASEVDEEGIVLGTFSYDINGPSIQTFPIYNQTEPRQYIEFAVVSNHGHPLYTCVYRLRVHGTMPG